MTDAGAVQLEHVQHPPAPQRLPSLGPGDLVVGRYQIEHQLGQGGFGAVFVATDRNLGRRVALKVMLADLLAAESGVDRFLREAELAQGLQHPNTVRLYDFGQTDSRIPYIAFELLSGRPLDQVIANEGPMPVERAVRVSSQILKSLMEAHSQGIVHRDIKPANIFLCEFPGEPDFVKVLDFGIAKSTATQGYTLTADGGMIGTPSYMAPEQVRGEPVGPPGDLYSLGLVIAEMLSGDVIVKGESGAQVVFAQGSEQPIQLPAAVTGSPIGRVVERALAKSAARRYPSAASMLQELEAALRTSSMAPTMQSPPAAAAFSATEPLPPSPSPARGAADGPGTWPSSAHPSTGQLTPAPVAGTVDMGGPAPRPSGGSSLKWIVLALVAVVVLGGAALFVVGAAGTFFYTSTKSAAAPAKRRAQPAKRRKVVELSDPSTASRGGGFENNRARKKLTAAGWTLGKPQTNFEGALTTRSFTIAKGAKKGTVSLSRFDDQDDAERFLVAARQRPGTAVKRDKAAVLIVWIHGDDDAADDVLKLITR